jgi:hypothetical protein
VSKSWIYELLARYRAEGETRLVARSRRPHCSPTTVAHRFEDDIVGVRKELVEAGYDAGADDPGAARPTAPESGPVGVDDMAVLKARGFVTPAPQAPEELLRALLRRATQPVLADDVTHLAPASGAEVKVLNLIDDHSRLCEASVARRVTKALDVVTTFHRAAARHGYPASVQSDNRCHLHCRGPPRHLCHGERTARPRHRLQALEAPPAGRSSGFTRP